MPKVLSDSAVTVVAEIHTPRWAYSDKPEKREKRDIENAREFERLVKTHVRPHMDAEYTIGMNVERQYVCSHCGFGWTEKSGTYNGGCCEEDEKANPELDPTRDPANQPENINT